MLWFLRIVQLKYTGEEINEAFDRRLLPHSDIYKRSLGPFYFQPCGASSVIPAYPDAGGWGCRDGRVVGWGFSGVFRTKRCVPFSCSVLRCVIRLSFRLVRDLVVGDF